MDCPFERRKRNLYSRNKTCPCKKSDKCMTSISKNVYINKQEDTVDKHNNCYCNTTKMKPIDVKSSTYIDFSIESNDKDPKFKEYQNIKKNAKTYSPSWSEEVSEIKKVKNTVPCTYVIEELNGKEIVETSYEKEFAVEKISKEKLIDYMPNGKAMIIYLIAG